MDTNHVSGRIAGPVVQAHIIHGDVHVSGVPDAPINQMPAIAPHFVGRQRELDFLTDRLENTTTVAITSIGGTAGIGKTTLALRWAHEHRDRFPDGQLYVDLLGFGPGEPLDPATVVQGFLAALQVPKERMPADVSAQFALYRSVLAGRNMLVLLDNARDSNQVRPLLPGSPSCTVLVTSRNELGGLIAKEGAARLTLALPSVEESRDMLTARLGEHRTSAAGDAVDALITRCARLPIALTIAAARAMIEPQRPLDQLVTELAELTTGDGAETDIRAVFHSSYRTLPPDGARMFRLLGLHPGTDVGIHAAASLAGLPLSDTRRLLSRLTRASLLSEHEPDRFRYHDLLREYATERAVAEESAEERRGAVTRVLDFYLHAAYANDRLLYPHRDTLSLHEPATGVSDASVTNRDEAWRWFVIERRNLLHALALAERMGNHRHVWQLGWSLSTYFGRTGNWHDWENAMRASVRSARQEGDIAGIAGSLRILGRIMTLIARYPEAVEHLEAALHMSVDPDGRAHIHQALSLALERAGALEEARDNAARAVKLARRSGHRLRQARGLSQLGRVQSELGANEDAYRSCELARRLLLAEGDRVSLGDATEGLGRAAHRLGRLDSAAEYYRYAIELFQEYDDEHSQAHVLHRLGSAYEAAGKPDDALEVWTQAAELLTKLEHPDADAVRAKAARTGLAGTADGAIPRHQPGTGDIAAPRSPDG